jgi:hypothetical protein
MGNRPFMPGSNLYGPSENIWGNVPVDQIFSGDRSAGWGIRDDFLKIPSTSLYDGYIRLATTGCSVAPISSEANHPGIVRLTIDGNAANDECVFQLGNGVDIGSFMCAHDGLAFEAYIRPSATTVSKWDWFIGLATGGAAGAAITDLLFIDTHAGVYATNDFIGFQKLYAESTALDGMYQASGVTKVDGAVNTDLDTIGTLVATTWIKVGLLYKPHPRRLSWFVDGVEMCHIDQAALDATSFPDATYLQPTFGAKDGAGNAGLTLDMDWWQCAQITCW